MIKAVIFDLDGTLADTFDDLTTTVNIMRCRRGMGALTVEEVKRCVGRGARMLLQGTLGIMDRDQIERALEEFDEIYSLHLVEKTNLYNGVYECINTLYEKKVKMAVLSNKPLRHTRKILEFFRINMFFDGIFGGDSFSKMKPDPAPVLEVIRYLGEEPSNTMMVGDSSPDLLAGRSVGTKVCLVTYGIYEKDLNPDYWIDDIRDVIRIIEK